MSKMPLDNAISISTAADSRLSDDIQRLHTSSAIEAGFQNEKKSLHKHLYHTGLVQGNIVVLDCWLITNTEFHTCIFITLLNNSAENSLKQTFPVFHHNNRGV
jgi:hypothetical protein